MNNCPNCQRPLQADVKFCSNCGCKIESGRTGKHRATGGKLSNKEIMKQAREVLREHWALAVGTMFVYDIIIHGVAYAGSAGCIASIIIAGSMTVGLSIFALSFSRKQDAKFEQIFKGFRKFPVALCAYLLFNVFILLWTLLLIIPGIIASLSYSQTFYIIAENDSIGPLQAIRKSKQIMHGHKWKYFCLQLRFIGWALLCILTFGIGFLWLMPYMTVSFARFYDDIAK